MDKKVTGFIIRRERMRRDWSQDGLCRGICAASYLSKIEQGRVTASEDILRLLYERLSLPWYGGESALPALSERIDALYEQVYSGEFEALSEELSALAPQRDALLLSPAAADISVLSEIAAWRGESADIDEAMEKYLAPRGLALLRLMQVPADAMPGAVLYLRITMLGILGNMGYNFNAGLLRGIGNSSSSLLLLFISCAANIVLDLVLTGALGLGIGGDCTVFIVDMQHFLHSPSLHRACAACFALRL